MVQDDYREKVLEAVRSANNSSEHKGYWSNLGDIVKAAKGLNINPGFGWNKIGFALEALTHSYQLEHTTLETTFGFREVWRDSAYTLEVLKKVHE